MVIEIIYRIFIRLNFPLITKNGVLAARQRWPTACFANYYFFSDNMHFVCEVTIFLEKHKKDPTDTANGICIGGSARRWWETQN